MSIHILKDMIDLDPGIAPMVKQAHVDKEYPLGNKEEVILTAIQVDYMTKVANERVPLETLEKVAKAVELYGVQEDVAGKSAGLVKAANYRSIDPSNEQQVLDYMDRLAPDMEKVAEAATALYENGEITNTTLLKVAGDGMIDKVDAMNALYHRTKTTGFEGFSKVANYIEATDLTKLTPSENRYVFKTVRDMEKSAGYHGTPFELTVMTKRASMTIQLANKSVPYESLVAASDAIGEVLGQDVADAINGDAAKSTIEALPLPERKLIEDLV